MKNSKSNFLAFSFVVLYVALTLFTTSAFAAKCPSEGIPPPGTTVNGGLEVDGDCYLEDVKVNGGIIVDENQGLELDNSTVNGGVVVLYGGELDAGAMLGDGTPNGKPSTINGGLTLDSPIDLDLQGGRVNGGITWSGGYASSDYYPAICDVVIDGSLKLNNIAGYGGLLIGVDPHPLFTCTGNTIHGSVTVVDTNVTNFGNNRVRGSLNCLSGGTVTNSGNNKISGSNTCY